MATQHSTQSPRRGLHPILIIAILITIVAVLGTYNYIRQTSPCTLGVTGYAANITFQGDQASNDCNLFIQQYPNHYYKMDEDPTGTILCEGTLSEGKEYYGINAGIPTGLTAGSHFTVRDTGMLDLVGGQICRDLMPSATQ